MMGTVWIIAIILVLLALYAERRVLVGIIQHRKTKKRYNKAKDDFISVAFDEINLTMSETLNVFEDIDEDLKACLVVGVHRKEEIENLIEINNEFKDEYAFIKSELSKKEHRNMESIEDIKKTLNNFKVRLNNELLVSTKQILSKIRKEYGIII